MGLQEITSTFNKRLRTSTDLTLEYTKYMEGIWREGVRLGWDLPCAILDQSGLRMVSAMVSDARLLIDSRSPLAQTPRSTFTMRFDLSSVSRGKGLMCLLNR